MPFKVGKNEYMNWECIKVASPLKTNYDVGISNNKGSTTMAKLWEMLDEAYYFINKNHFYEAQDVLDRILSADPQNVEAWDAYINTCKTRRDLELLRSHILHVWQTRVRNDYLLATQRFVLQRLDEKMNSLYR
jgi:hypothetical protein